MKLTSDHVAAAKSELLKWGVPLASNSFPASVVSERFGKWKYVDQFFHIVPQQIFTLATGERELLFLWGGDDICDALSDYTSNDRFLVIGSLCDGSYLAIDTARTTEMQIGAFPFEECSTAEGMLVSDEGFVRFPFQYHEYLNYLHTAPEFDHYLFGYGR